MKKHPTLTRRQFLNRALIGSAALGVVGLGYSLKRGLRYPTLGLEPHPLATEFRLSNNEINILSGDVIQVPDYKQADISLRTFSPEPKLIIRSDERKRVNIWINNLSAEAVLEPENSSVVIDESINGISRSLTLSLVANQELELRWRLPFTHDYTFASIGDSGGDKELAWCLQRAHEVGAKFLLHLGDFNYQESDYRRSIKLFHESPIPCYISIGNHDFHDNGMIYPQFLTELGPLNHAFVIGKTRFVNIDTAASMFPYSAGKRGKLLASLEASNQLVNDTVSFTHRPLHDPLENSTHDIGSEGERNWLIASLKRIQSPTLLSGHIHIYDRSDFMGIDNIIAGQGLGHQDILTNSDYSKLVIGEVAEDGRVSYSTTPLSMPMELHCHPRSQSAKDALLEPGITPEHRALLDLINASCGDDRTV